jgi:hypothetical protein
MNCDMAVAGNTRVVSRRFGRRGSVDRMRRGRIFDISDIEELRRGTYVQILCGFHTHTLVTAPNDRD